MEQQPIQTDHSSHESHYESNKSTIKLTHIFDWGFWTASPLAVLGLFVGGILLASITSFPGGNPKSLWYFAGGLWIVLGVIVYWVFSGIIARMEGRELLTTQEIAEQEKGYREGIQTQLNNLGLNYYRLEAGRFEDFVSYGLKSFAHEGVT